VQVDIELLGPLVDYLPVSAKGQITIATRENSTIADILKILKIKQKVVVAVNGDEEKVLDHVLFDGDKLLVFTLVSGG
jgi:sulfur carrier protein ThiS